MLRVEQGRPSRPACAGFAQFRHARPRGALRSVTPKLHGFAAAHWWRRCAPYRVPFLRRPSRIG